MWFPTMVVSQVLCIGRYMWSATFHASRSVRSTPGCGRIVDWWGVSIWNLVFCGYSMCYVSLLLAAVRYVRRSVTLWLMFQRFIICVPCFQFFLSPIPAALNGVDFWLPFWKCIVAEVGMFGSQRFSLLICLLLFCFNPVYLSLSLFCRCLV